MAHEFNVIIVGAGPVGLTAAHALSKAGINFTVLERRERIEENIGATIVLWPHGIRVLAQLGLEAKLRTIGTELQKGSHQLHSGKVYNITAMPEIVKTNFGTYALTFARSDLVSLLYSSLSSPDQARILPNKKVTSITTESQSGFESAPSGRVKVTCSDGTTYSSTIIIGADGVHSATRKSMHALGQTPPEPLFPASYRVMWFTFPHPSGVSKTSAYESHGKDMSSQLLNTTFASFAFVYQRIPGLTDNKPVTEHVRYTPEDIEAVAVQAGHLPVGESGLKLGDVWNEKTQAAGMANLEEGVLEQWSWGGKIVLIGDAAHKITSNQGFGLNDGMIDVVALVNEVRRVLLDSSSAVPSEGALQEAFQQYQQTRKEWVTKNMQSSKFTTRLSTWRDKLLWFLVRTVLIIPGLESFLISKLYNPILSESGLAFEGFEMEGEPFEGKVPWRHAVPKGAKK